MTNFFKTSAGAVLIILALQLVPTAYAEGSMSMILAPHCTEADRTLCPSFGVVDGEHIKTARLAAGDIVDLDVVVKGTDYASVRTVRAWLEYDPAVLEARSVELTSALPSPIPDEQTIDQAAHIIKIGGSTRSGLPSSDAAVARVTFRVLSTNSDTTLSFIDYRPDGTAKTAVNGPRESDGENGALPAPPCSDVLIGCRDGARPLLSSEPAKLIVTLAGLSAVPLTGQVAGAGQVSSSAPAAMNGVATSFSLLQVQEVRVTSKDDMIFLGWQPLKSSELAGYNVYYSTVSGRYLQRRSLPANSSSVVIRDLEPGATYYLAVRAVNTREQESVFSQEVSVVAGKPETATSPMTNIPSDVSAPENPAVAHNGTSVQGETGITSIVMMLLLTSAILGTGFAFKRQLALHSLSTRG